MKLRKFITPVSIAFHENGKPLAVQGETVIWSTWWQRRLNDGDISIQNHKASSKAIKKTDKKAKKS